MEPLRIEYETVVQTCGGVVHTYNRIWLKPWWRTSIHLDLIGGCRRTTIELSEKEKKTAAQLCALVHSSFDNNINIVYISSCDSHAQTKVKKSGALHNISRSLH